ncbi:hypothetical protein [Campylobacter hyointestinalis]|uniref:Uncharacterized protein n=1 Tax=Campylobacter hyointestinalis subsp. hyointestinalis TaxID=91352 RepID=A0A855N9T9_CAMHY|nr:hypothetical protein [Campylobacter hyointestinalis]MBT0611695.1 hypothetical protein [Campylobacter hyointestinalis subsp. hyointestinalis]MDY2998805.1 hypothetical protein [Campylobacter hyointestinalis]PPB60193.1 hypothetical protein CDQ70_01555 [Campylobacter hyointestinalis subsp. hyointestinalis]PPB63849.1 hypothetical protein CDQ74_03310 [Campylobacter hyointestinalis subsp. hyointestinalis]PPB73116.1 hypothetical protein CDQ78_01720 [Campylobacter hyointestinalis subsp. hyointestina
MQVNNDVLFGMNSSSNVSSKQSNDEDSYFEKLLESLKQSNSSDSDLTSITNTEEFANKLSELGSAAFLIAFNLEKIEAKLEEKRKELMSALDVENLSDEDKIKALASIEKALDNYEKELLEKLRIKELAEQKEDKNLEKGSLKSLLSSI